MRNKSLMTSVFALAIVALTAFTACGGDDDDGANNPPDAAPVTTPDAMVTVPDAAIPVVSAADLGKVCTANSDCASGICIGVEMTATSGFCTLQCGSGMTGDSTKCDATNGFPGPGTGVCALSLQDGRNVCAVTCSNAATDCPTGLTCKDLFDASTMMSGMDGMKDLCAP
jgi:hypothetical protein